MVAITGAADGRASPSLVCLGAVEVRGNDASTEDLLSFTIPAFGLPKFRRWMPLPLGFLS